MKKAARACFWKVLGKSRSGRRKMMAKTAKKRSQMMPAVRRARRGLADQKMERVAKNGKSEKRKKRRSLNPGKSRGPEAILTLINAINATISKMTSQRRGRESSKFMEALAPRGMMG